MRLRVSNLRRNLERARQQERAASGLEPEPLQRHRGEERFRRTLETDKKYRWLLFGALVLAIISGTGFGRLFFRADAITAALWCAMAVGLVLSCMTPHSNRHVVRTLAVATLLATLGWTIRAYLQETNEGAHFSPTFVTGAACLLLIAFAYLKAGFATVVAAVMVLHVAADPGRTMNLHGMLWLQIPFVVLEFLLLIVAGYRYTLASMLRLPQSTYRISPLCVVPRLDRDEDHPMQIDVPRL